MKSALNIYELADEVLNEVSAQEQTKVAEAPALTLKTDIGQALKAAATSVKEARETEITYDEINDLVTAVIKHAASTGVSTPPVEVKAAAEVSDAGSPLGTELRKAAATLRLLGQKAAEDRVVKAAQILTAAVGLEQLKRGIK